MVDFILGDIGGTNSRLKFYDCKEKKYIKEIDYITNDFKSLSDLLAEFKKNLEINNNSIKVYIAIAGNPNNNKIDKLANINWTSIDCNEIIKEFNFLDLKLLNDFEAIGYSINWVKKENLLKIYSGDIKSGSNYNKLIIGLGTGLGGCLIINNKNKSNLVIPTEIGHIMFCPLDKEDHELIDYYKDILNKETNNNFNFINIERIICGVGIPYLYRFICKKLSKEPKFNTCKEIFKNYNLEECKETIKYFIKYLSYAIYNLVVSFLPKNGIYFINVIMDFWIKEVYKSDVNKFYWELKMHFDTFENNVFQNTINHIPFYFINEKNWGILGSLSYALQNL